MAGAQQRAWDMGWSWPGQAHCESSPKPDPSSDQKQGLHTSVTPRHPWTQRASDQMGRQPVHPKPSAVNAH